MGIASIEAARAFVRILGDDSPVRKTLAGLQKRVESFASGLRTVGMASLGAAAVATAPLLAAAAQFAETGGQLDDMAQVTGISAENLSRLGYAAKLSGTDLESVGKASIVLNKNLKEAAGGSKGAQETFQKLGLSVSDLQNMKPEARFLKIADALSKIEDPSKRSVAAMEILGKAGANLSPMMAQGSAGILKLMGESDSLGNTMSNEQVAAAAEFGDSLDRLWTVFGALVVQIGAGLAPMLQFLADIVTENGSNVVAFVRDNALLIAGIGAGVIVLGLFGAAMVAVGTVLAAVSATVAFALSPLGLLIGALGVLGVVGIQSAGGVSSALEWLSETFGPLADRAKESFGAIKGALMAGDWQAAARVLWAALQMEWLQGTNAIKQEWLIWKQAFLDTLYSALGAAKKMWAEWQGWIAQKALSVMAYFDGSIDVNAASAELDSMLQSKLDAIDRQTTADRAAAQTAFEGDLAGVQSDLEAARAEWAAAVSAANTVAERTANEPSAADIAQNRFSQLLEELRAGDIATRVDAAVKTSGGALDVRTVQGSSVISELMNKEREVSRKQLQSLERIEEYSRRQVALGSRRIARV